MAEKIPMLALSPTMEQGTIVTWVKKEGEEVKSGDVLCEVETDKATMEYETSTEGTLLKILKPAGTKASVGEPIAVVGASGEDISAMAGEAPKAVQTEPRKEASQAPAMPSQKAEGQGERITASPRARKLAVEMGVDLSTIAGSGPSGRIVERDVIQRRPAKSKAATGPTAPLIENKSVPITEKRRAIAKRMSESAFSAPHYYLTTPVNMDAILAARARLKEQGTSLSLNAFLIRFAAEALRRNPTVNSSWKGETIEMHGHADIAIAVAQPDGLVAPVVRACEEKSISQIDAELRPLVEAAREGRLGAEAYANPTFTISNLGSYDIEQFTAIINPPASAIMAIGKAQLEPTVNQQSGAIESHNMMRVTLSCDHRVIDGAVGAKFLTEFKMMLESPVMAMV
jgi:pyruvate dehydrogenase E2 component (dihydrolipoamide acetyltransferase)